MHWPLKMSPQWRSAALSALRALRPAPARDRGGLAQAEPAVGADLGSTLPAVADWIFSAKTFAAAMIAFYIALAAGLDHPYWSIATVYVVAQPLAGAMRAKGIYRLCGTVVGAIAAIILVPNLVDAPVLLVGALCLWLGLCLYLALCDRTPRAYLFMLAGYTAAVETVTSKMRSTIDAAALCKMADRGQIRGGLLDGPLAFDNAVSLVAAKTKGIISGVAGRADILVVPELESGNMVAKQLEYLADAVLAGVVLGTRVPIVLTSRADSAETRTASCAIAQLIAHKSGRKSHSRH